MSEDTLKWLDFYYSLPESGRDALSMVPSEFAGEMFPSAAVAETDAGDISYLDALTEEEVLQTEALAQQYFIEDAPMFEGVDQIYPVTADTTLYGNAGCLLYTSIKQMKPAKEKEHCHKYKAHEKSLYKPLQYCHLQTYFNSFRIRIFPIIQSVKAAAKSTPYISIPVYHGADCHS